MRYNVSKKIGYKATTYITRKLSNPIVARNAVHHLARLLRTGRPRAVEHHSGPRSPNPVLSNIQFWIYIGGIGRLVDTEVGINATARTFLFFYASQGVMTLGKKEQPCGTLHPSRFYM
jgi:hypothetical protein